MVNVCRCSWLSSTRIRAAVLRMSLSVQPCEIAVGCWWRVAQMVPRHLRYSQKIEGVPPGVPVVYRAILGFKVAVMGNPKVPMYNRKI